MRILGIAMAAVSILLAGCTEGEPEHNADDPHAFAPVFVAETIDEWTTVCDLPRERSDLYSLELDSDGRSMSLFAYPESGRIVHTGSDSAFFFDHVRCMTEQLDAPFTVWINMANTVETDGEQSASWDQYTATWHIESTRLFVEFAQD